MLLEQENLSPIQDPSWADIETAVSAIHPRTRSYFILTGSSGYVQAAGARLRLTIEYRDERRDPFSHYRLGSFPISDDEISLNYSGGGISVRKSEVLTLDECLKVFRHFFETESIPSDFAMRELTATFR